MAAGKRNAVIAFLSIVSLATPPAGHALFGQAAPPSASPIGWTAAQDHQNLMDQLGIRSLRPGPNGNESAPNHANYDEAKANPFPHLPDVLTLKNGAKVTTDFPVRDAAGK